MDSKILTDEEKLTLRQLFIDNKYEMHPEWKLLYRGSENEFDSYKWNDKCTQRQNVISIIHSEHDNVFGGFTANGWKKPTEHEYQVEYQKDEKACLYLLRSNKGYKSEIFGIKNVEKDIERALPAEIGHMSCFGDNGYDIAIINKCNVNNKSCAGWIYQTGSYKTPENEWNYLNGNVQNFLVKEMEVFMNVASE